MDRADNPLDEFSTVPVSGGTDLVFDNAAIRLGIAAPSASYDVDWFALDNATGTDRPAGRSDMSLGRIRIPESAWGPRDARGVRYAVASIRTNHRSYPAWTAAVAVTIRDNNGLRDVVGIERPTGRS